MTKTAAIKVEGLYKSYKVKNGGDKVALKHVDLEIPEGSFFGLLGPNGAGKSTFINILAGLVNKTEGSVNICGYDIDKQTKAARKSIGIVPQELVLDPFFPPFEALENTAGYYGVPKDKRRTQEIIDAVGLSDKAFSPARRLSGGMKRRLLIAKALVHSPKVLVLDEPTAGVDVELRTQLWEYVTKLNKEGTTIVLTTHYLEEAEELCDKIAVIDHGKIIANDTKKNVMKTIDRKKIVIVGDKEIKKIPKELSEYNASINTEGNLEIEYRTSKISIDHILKDVAKSNITIRDLSTEEADLEEIFKYLTKKAS
jgi:ABC-2 type transport system ATP-binding protein